MSTFLRLLALIVPYWPSMLMAAVLSFLTVGSGVGLMTTATFLISSAALHPPVLDLMPAVVGVRFFGLSRAVFRYLERYFSHQATFQVLGHLRVWFYRAVEPLAPARLMDYRSGDLLSRIVADVETLQNFYLRVLAPPLVALLILAGAFFFLSRFDIKIALVLVAFFLTAGGTVPLVLRFFSRGLGRQQVEVRASLNVHLVDTIQGMTEIVACGREARQRELVGVLSRRLLNLQGRLAGISGLSGALTGLAANLALWFILLLAIPPVNRGELDGVYLAVLALGAQAVFEAVTPLPMACQHLEESLAAARRLFKLIDARPAVVDPPGPGPEPSGFILRVRGLRFRYGPEEPYALDGVDFLLPEGGRLAIVGPSGSGKSTLVNLLLRFWDYHEGSICLGGHELKAYRQEDLHKLMAVVTQHTHLFNATIRENLLLARPDAGEEELVEAARLARIHDFILNLPRGYDTYVGEGGFKLSGGQRRRLAIARALLKNAPVLILDEATAGLDPVTERELLQAIYRLMEGRTTLVITHRLTGLEVMDQILVLQAGRVVERGRHGELLQQGGLYRRLWEEQQRVLAVVP
ncbi:MAG TPA: thiol reductant ABC exporter subunit CydC [Desulfotomaculum sp.]|nr:thiol reductant ABC exporter subunit CydC [Desulfotomaculum sp.]